MASRSTIPHENLDIKNYKEILKEENYLQKKQKKIKIVGENTVIYLLVGLVSIV